MKKTIYTLSLLLSTLVSAPTVAVAQSTQILDHNNVSAAINNDGSFFRQIAGQQNAHYEVPKASGISPIYVMNPWVSAYDTNGQFRFAANRYQPSLQGFFPGPIATSGDYSNSAYVNTYGSSLWSVTAAQIQQHINNYQNTGYVVPAPIAEWPGNGLTQLGVASNLAPFIDLNNNGVYEPGQGEYPDILGDAAVYVILNDLSELPTDTTHNKLGIELHGLFYQFSSNDINNTNTYAKFKLFNRSGQTYDSLKFGMFLDFDLGNFNDDYIGCDTLRQAVYAYNGDDVDEPNGSSNGYQQDIPAFGVQSLNHNLGSFACFSPSYPFPYTDSVQVTQFANTMNGMWADGSPMVYGGSGFSGSVGSTNHVSKFNFTGNPADTLGWSMQENEIPSGDYRGVFVLEPIALQHNDFECFDFGFVFSRTAGQTRMENIAEFFEDLDTIQAAYDQSNEGKCELYTLGISPIDEPSAFSLYPNPTNGKFWLDLGTNHSAQVQITDINGRLILQKSIIDSAIHSLDLSGYQTGMYLITLNVNDSRYTKRILLE